MLPPSPMLAQINSVRGATLLLMAALLLSGCTPAGPRALLKGKKYLDRGDVTDAVVQFKRATSLLTTNANAWNYLGVALQRNGQPDEAVSAYQNALKLDHDLIEVHYNLGCLALEQGRPDLAKFEFTAYTMRRPADANGWLKLGFAQLKAGEAMPAERSFSSVMALKQNEAEALNGLGLASVQLGKYSDASRFFAGAIQARPDFATAVLNLANVNQQYLHDNRAALANYQSYLTLAPHAANYNDVKAIVASLMPSDVATTVMTPAVVIKTSTPPVEPRPRPAPTTVTTIVTPRPTPVAHTEPNEPYVNHVPPRTNYGTTPVSTPLSTSVTPQIVQVRPAPQIVTTPRTNPAIVVNTPLTPLAPVHTNPVVAANDPLELPVPDEQPKSGFWHRLFGASDKSATNSKARPSNNFTPIPANNDQIAGTKPEEEKPVEPKPAPVTSFARYNYTSPPKPTPGDRRSAEGAFTKARMAEQDEKWVDAEQWYQTAADADPSWFEAQYNTGVIAHQLQNYSVALPRYEMALAIKPESVDARYNFALVLKASGYALDAAEELKKILAANPSDVRTHLTLANLCARSLHDIPQAREHYKKVLELQPDNPQASDIRFWLSGNASK